MGRKLCGSRAAARTGAACYLGNLAYFRILPPYGERQTHSLSSQSKSESTLRLFLRDSDSLTTEQAHCQMRSRARAPDLGSEATGLRLLHPICLLPVVWEGGHSLSNSVGSAPM